MLQGSDEEDASIATPRKAPAKGSAGFSCEISIYFFIVYIVYIVFVVSAAKAKKAELANASNDVADGRKSALATCRFVKLSELLIIVIYIISTNIIIVGIIIIIIIIIIMK